MPLLIGIHTGPGAVVACAGDRSGIAAIDAHILVAATGHAGLVQRCRREIERVHLSGVFDDEADVNVVIRHLQEAIRGQLVPELQSAAAAQAVHGGRALSSAHLETLIVFPVHGECHLFHFDGTGACLEAVADSPVAVCGPGAEGAQPLLDFVGRLLWPERVPTREEALFAAAWTAAQLRPGRPLQLYAVAPSAELDWVAQMEEPAPWLERVRKVEEKWGEVLPGGLGQ
jgi:hypothetical protein